MHGQYRFETPEIRYIVEREAIAHRYGWTFDHVDSLPVEYIASILATMDGEARYNKMKEAEGKRGRR